MLTRRQEPARAQWAASSPPLPLPLPRGGRCHPWWPRRPWLLPPLSLPPHRLTMTTLAISGSREAGQDVRSANVAACVTVANILRSSLGPQGLDKMLVDELGEVTVTNDGATIVGLLEVEHPAARVLTELAAQQDEEVGDGTTSVVLLAAELLRRANDLVVARIHPANIIAGYRLAMREACKYIREKMVCLLSPLFSGPSYAMFEGPIFIQPACIAAVWSGSCLLLPFSFAA